MEELENDTKKNGLQEPIILAVCKESQKAYITEGNHRMIILDKLECHWVPLKVNYFFTKRKEELKSLHFIPRHNPDLPKKILPSDCGFVRNIETQ